MSEARDLHAITFLSVRASAPEGPSLPAAADGCPKVVHWLLPRLPAHLDLLNHLPCKILHGKSPFICYNIQVKKNKPTGIIHFAISTPLLRPQITSRHRRKTRNQAPNHPGDEDQQK